MFPLQELDEPGGRRDANKARTRAQLSAAALRLFASQGYDDTSVEQIALEAEVSLRTFFRYFTSKEDVLFARSFDLGGFLTGVRSQPASLSPLAAVAAAYAQQRPLRPDEVRVMLLFRQALTSTATLEGIYSGQQRSFRRVLATVLAGRASRRKPNADDAVLAAVAQTLLDVAYERWTATGAKGQPARHVAAAFATLGA